MEKTIIRVLVWVQLVLLFGLIMNHMFRCLNWLPLCLLFVPAIAMVWFTEKEVNNG